MVRIVDTGMITEASIRNMDAGTKEWVYNGLDCCVTLEICEVLREQIDDVSSEIYDLSRSLQAPVLEMTARGTRIDKNKLKLSLEQIYRDMTKLEEHLTLLIEDGIGVNLNWRSPKQLIVLFYQVMNYKEIKKRNSNGGFSPTADREALEKLSVNFYAEPICNHLLKLRDLDKQRQLLETKLDADGRMRSSWGIAGTTTGRFNSSESDFGTGTNNQNINKKVRQAFIADKGMKLANLDLEQADARNLGAVCWNLFVETKGEEYAGKFLDACESGDLHTFVCSLGWPTLDWCGDYKRDRAIADGNGYRDFSYRDLAKRLGHGSNYMGMVNVAKAIKMPMAQIELFQARYFAGFPAIPDWHEWVQNQLIDYGYITTQLGRRRFFFGRPRDKNNLRQAIAFEPQSMTGDELNRGLINLWRGNKVQILNQVHDSILFQYPEELEHEIIPWAIKQMTIELELKKSRKFIVPVEAKVGWNWADHSEENKHGLIKYDGNDTRVAPTYRFYKPSLWNLMQ